VPAKTPSVSQAAVGSAESASPRPADRARSARWRPRPAPKAVARCVGIGHGHQSQSTAATPISPAGGDLQKLVVRVVGDWGGFRLREIIRRAILRVVDEKCAKSVPIRGRAAIIGSVPRQMAGGYRSSRTQRPARQSAPRPARAANPALALQNESSSAATRAPAKRRANDRRRGSQQPEPAR